MIREEAKPKRHPKAGRGNDARAGSGAGAPGGDYTAAILHFLESAHGKTRVDDKGDFYYSNVSAVSLHFLLNAELPGREVLWQWYQHFDRSRSESIYQTLAPLQDEELLDVLDACEFAWDSTAVRGSGLVFLGEHRALVYLMLQEFLELRLEAFRSLDDGPMREELTPKDTWSDNQLARLVQRIQIQPLTPEQRRVIYDQFDSGYLKATARHLLDQSAQEAFWREPPQELEEFEARLIAFVRQMTAEARRLGVHVSKAEFEQRTNHRTWEEGFRWSRGAGREEGGFNHRRHVRESHFATLGLTLSASLSQVKSAYREMVKQRHPDQGGTVQDFLRIQEAYEYLLTEVF
ncbi:MAG: DnaJ domain-containing protein [bacterium]